ncbi:MAG: methyltransferase domain-containing protein [Chloroflexi bacterium]|nr:methyltransferase domain-containing protein [Chloroflexota bacterium]
MNLHKSTGKQIDDATVRRYFNGAGGGTASTVSMMAHEHNLPAGAARYRLRKEMRTISDWLDEVCASGQVLDVGCGAGAWAEVFAKRYDSVIGIEQSPLMVKAARERVACLPNVEILEGDGRNDLPEGYFDMIFLGGLCMYLNDTDVVALLNSLKSRLVEGGSIILRESTVRQGVSLAKGDYQAVYRSVSLYNQLFGDAGPFSMEVRRNYGYTSMVTAEELVDLRRRWMPFLPSESTMLGSLTWWALRGTTPFSFWALPRVLSRLNISWPRLQNHFFRLRLAD